MSDTTSKPKSILIDFSGNHSHDDACTTTCCTAQASDSALEKVLGIVKARLAQVNEILRSNENDDFSRITITCKNDLPPHSALLLKEIKRNGEDVDVFVNQD